MGIVYKKRGQWYNCTNLLIHKSRAGYTVKDIEDQPVIEVLTYHALGKRLLFFHEHEYDAILEAASHFGLSITTLIPEKNG